MKNKRLIQLLFLLFTISLHIFSQEKYNIAVMELDAEGISKSENKIISERLRTNLFGTGKFVILERQKMQDVLSEQGFQLGGCSSNECVVEIGKIVGVQQMVAGSIGKIGSIYTINIRLIDVETGIVSKTAIEDCRCTIEQVLTQAINRVAIKLAGENTTPPPTIVKQSNIPATTPDPQQKDVIKKQPVKPQRTSYPLHTKKQNPKMSIGLALGKGNYDVDADFFDSGNLGFKPALKSNFELSLGYQLNSYLKIGYFIKTHLIEESVGDNKYSGNLSIRAPKFQVFVISWVYLSYSFASINLKIDKNNDDFYNNENDKQEIKKSVSMYSIGLDAPVHRNVHLSVELCFFTKYFAYTSGILFLF